MRSEKRHIRTKPILVSHFLVIRKLLGVFRIIIPKTTWRILVSKPHFEINLKRDRIRVSFIISIMLTFLVRSEIILKWNRTIINMIISRVITFVFWLEMNIKWNTIRISLLIARFLAFLVRLEMKPKQKETMIFYIILRILTRNAALELVLAIISSKASV